ncbi:TnsD family Tn7-like transposition protein [Ralstonia holmesii]|uniref:TnsD family Tn7-like transposition protein n=1 Tax=Ralstonia holmesii TaxID=3058602 RepID=UPI003F15E435
MPIALPLPYEDELLYSVIARYMELLAVDKPTNVVQALFGLLRFPSADLMCGLGELARQTYDSWGLSSKEIADLYTPLPYYASYATDRARKAAYQAIARDGHSRASQLLGQATTRVVGPVNFRFCAQCAREDIANHGEAYWRRSFQLPGVIACPKHRLSLLESSVPTRPRSSTEWHTANTLITASLEDDSKQNSLWNGNLHLLEVARRSIDLLAHDTTESFPAMGEHYLSLARAAGLTRPSGIVDVDVLSREMRAMYGEDFLNATGLSESPDQGLKWLKDMMSRKDASYQPLQHILLSHLLECFTTSTENAGQAKLTARQNFTCPNPYATHGVGHVIEKVKVTQTADGRIGRAYCSCGMKFSFRRCRAGTTEPEIVRVADYGKDWRESARAMKRKGVPPETIATEMGVSVHSVKAMVGRKHARDAILVEVHILEWRRQWNLLLETVAPLGHEAARNLNESLYLRLNRHDTAWFRESGRRCKRKPKARPRGPRVDWETRDKAWSEALRAAAANLYASASRPMRVSVAAIIEKANVFQFSLRRLKRLPMCRAALSELAESIEQFQILRLEREAQSMFDQGQSIVPWKLLRRVGMQKPQVTPLIQATIDRLVDGVGARSLQGL